MKKTMMRCALALPLLLLGACGEDDGPTSPSGPATPAPPAPTVTGTWNTSWLVQFRREHDGYNGAFTCPGQMTLTQTGESFRGFAVVNPPCSPSSFDVTGTVQGNGAVNMAAAGPRPGAGTCPPPAALTFTGLLNQSQLSVRASTTIDCPGEGEGAHRFDYIVTGFRR